MNRAVFDKVKRVLLYMTIEHFNQSMSRTFHEDPKESHKLVENVPFKVHALLII